VVQPNGVAAFPRIGFMPMAFPDIARIQAQMDQQMAQMHAMMQHANAMAAQSFAAGANGPLAISTGGSHFCARSVQITTGADGKQNVVTSGTGRREADDQACGRDDAVVGAEHRGAQPADATRTMSFTMMSGHAAPR